MIKSQKNTLKKNKIIFFDVDGVLINSLKNMNISWNSCMKKFGIIKNFSKYSVLIGLPFEDILSNLNIKNNKKLIKEHYGKTSKKNINKITLYPKVKESLNKLSKHYQLGIVTSKSKGRTFFFLKKFKLIKYFKYISCPQKGIKGKPHSDQMNLIIKKTKIKKKMLFLLVIRSLMRNVRIIQK